MYRIVANVQSSETTEVDLTAEEIAEIQSQAQAEPMYEPTPEEKLATAGLTLDELKQLLGI